MAWSTPKTWATNDPLNTTNLNTYIRDNQLHLIGRLNNNGLYLVDEVSSYTTTSTTFVDIDATNLSLSLTVVNGVVLVGFFAGVKASGAYSVYLELNVDGAQFLGDDGLFIKDEGSGNTKHIGAVWQVTGLSAASHTFKMQWKVSAGTGTLWAVSNHPQFWVQEI